ncbi:MAG: PQQ-binding-like beta-propeller repeat protein, partial [Planctomycetota bacterium]
HRELWKKRMNGLVTRPVYAEGSLVLVNSSEITAIEPDTGRVRWRIPNGAAVRAVNTGSGLVFVLTADLRRVRDLTLRCLSPRNGEVVWSRQIPDHSVYDVLLVADEAVGIASLEPAGVSVFDLSTGRLRYRVAMKKNALGRVPKILDGDKLLVVHAAKRVDLHDLTTGAVLWSRDLDRKRRYRSGVAASGTVIYADSRDHLVAIDAASGVIRWDEPPRENTSILSTGDAADAELVFTIRRRDKDNSHNVTARSLRTGKEIWKRELIRARNADFATEVTERYLVIHVNAFDHGESAWTSKTLFFDKQDGTTVQELTADALQGSFTTVILGHGLLSLSAQGRVAVFGPK